MTAYNLNNIEFAIINDLRINIVDPNSRGSTTVDLFDGDGNETDFVLTHAANSVSVVLNSVLQKYGTEYTLSDDGTTVSFLTAPPVGTNNVVIASKYGETWIYPDFAKPNITISDFPRISCSVISSSTTPNAIGGAQYRSSMMVSVIVAGKTRKQINSLINEVRDRLLNNNKSFGLFSIIEPSAESAIQDSNLHQRIMQRTIDFFIPYVQEVA